MNIQRKHKLQLKLQNKELLFFFSDEHSKKALAPIEVTEEGIVICDNNEHPEKA